jgi:hypothetical protein
MSQAAKKQKTDDVSEEVLRQRLQAKEAALRNLTKHWLAFAHAIESSTVEECEPLYQALLQEIDAYEFAVRKAEALIDTNVRQVADYDAMQQSVEAEMCAVHVLASPHPPTHRRRAAARRSSTKADIDRLAVQLEHEKTVRQQKEQYAALAKKINAYPSREVCAPVAQPRRARCHLRLAARAPQARPPVHTQFRRPRSTPLPDCPRAGDRGRDQTAQRADRAAPEGAQQRAVGARRALEEVRRLHARRARHAAFARR